MWRWILNLVVVLILLRLVLRFVLGVFQGMGEPSRDTRGRGRGPDRAKVAGALVQDPICGTYIPRESAIAVSVGAGTRFYCSEACRDKDRFVAPAVKGRAANG